MRDVGGVSTRRRGGPGFQPHRPVLQVHDSEAFVHAHVSRGETLGGGNEAGRRRASNAAGAFDLVAPGGRSSVPAVGAWMSHPAALMSAAGGEAELSSPPAAGLAWGPFGTPRLPNKRTDVRRARTSAVNAGCRGDGETDADRRRRNARDPLLNGTVRTGMIPPTCAEFRRVVGQDAGARGGPVTTGSAARVGAAGTGVPRAAIAAPTQPGIAARRVRGVGNRGRQIPKTAKRALEAQEDAFSREVEEAWMESAMEVGAFGGFGTRMATSPPPAEKRTREPRARPSEFLAETAGRLPPAPLPAHHHVSSVTMSVGKAAGEGGSRRAPAPRACGAAHSANDRTFAMRRDTSLGLPQPAVFGATPRCDDSRRTLSTEGRFDLPPRPSHVRRHELRTGSANPASVDRIEMIQTRGPSRA